MLEISVIIPCFNAAPWISEALNSVLGQGLDDIEIIVVDDGSADGSAGIVESEFKSVRLVRTGNHGPSRARNIGTGLSEGKFIQYLDADDILAPGKLKTQLEALKNSGADVAYGEWQKLVKNEEGQYSLGEIIKKEIKNPEIDLFTDYWCPIHSYMFSRAIVEKIGGWNENLPIIQDARFTLDCALHGARFVHCPGVSAYYRMHSSGSVSTGNSAEFVRDCFKNAAGVEAWWTLHGGITGERKQALLKVYGQVARGSFENDKTTFKSVYAALERLEPHYIPHRPESLRIISGLLGYERAEHAAVFYRKIKKAFKGRS